jgi:protocatechuate 3,4-dioxygenase alpha subunit
VDTVGPYITDTQPNRDLGPTPSQTVGPFYGYALPYEGGGDLVPGWTAGAIRIHGTVYDGAGQVIPDAIVEIWQADAEGRVPAAEGSFVRDGATFTGWGRASVDRLGHYAFSTVRPGGEQPYIAVSVFARGMLKRVVTRIYFPGASDALLDMLDADRRETLIAQDEGGAAYRFDIRIQGERETVFLEMSQP